MVKVPDSMEFLPLIEQLEALGFFRFVKPERLPRLKATFLKKPNFWVWISMVKRSYPADSESLAEGGVERFFRRLRPRLKQCGVPFPKLQEGDSPGYSLALNSIWYDLFSEADLEIWHSWDITTRRSFALINKLFRDHGTDERIYSFYDVGWGYILTEAQFAAFANSTLPDKEDILDFRLYHMDEFTR
jgi:hypothetical protein